MILRSFTSKSRPESGVDCHICAIFARQRYGKPFRSSQPSHVASPSGRARSSLSRPHTPTHAHTFSLTPTPTHPHTHLPTRTHTHTHTRTHTHTHTFCLSLSVAHTRTQIFCRYRSIPHTLTHIISLPLVGRSEWHSARFSISSLETQNFVILLCPKWPNRQLLTPRVANSATSDAESLSSTQIDSWHDPPAIRIGPTRRF